MNAVETRTGRGCHRCIREQTGGRDLTKGGTPRELIFKLIQALSQRRFHQGPLHLLGAPDTVTLSVSHLPWFEALLQLDCHNRITAERVFFGLLKLGTTSCSPSAGIVFRGGILSPHRVFRLLNRRSPKVCSG